MDMWNWLLGCYNEGFLTLKDLEKVMIDDIEAKRLWEDYIADSEDFFGLVRDEVLPFIDYITKNQ